MLSPVRTTLVTSLWRSLDPERHLMRAAYSTLSSSSLMSIPWSLPRCSSEPKSSTLTLINLVSKADSTERKDGSLRAVGNAFKTKFSLTYGVNGIQVESAWTFWRPNGALPCKSDLFSSRFRRSSQLPTLTTPWIRRLQTFGRPIPMEPSRRPESGLFLMLTSERP